MLNVALVDGVILLNWIWPLSADGLGVVYLIAEVIGIDSLAVGGVWLLVSIFIAWLVRGWWYWIIGLEVVLAIVLLIGVTIAAGIVRLWIDTLQNTAAERVKEWRLGMRSEKDKMKKEIESLKKQLGK